MKSGPNPIVNWAETRKQIQVAPSQTNVEDFCKHPSLQLCHFPPKILNNHNESIQLGTILDI